MALAVLIPCSLSLRVDPPTVWRADRALPPLRPAVMRQTEESDSLSFRTRLREANVDPTLLADLSSLYNVWHPKGRSGGRGNRMDTDFRWGARPKFAASAATPASLPAESLPEVALIGRSNVGKSSLLNALMGQVGAARVSDKPGKTQQLAFFLVGAKKEEFYLVDMPGYGFALAGERDVARWQALCQHYLQKRKMLKLVVVLVDGRTGLKRSDLQMIEYLESCNVKYTIVHTKCDVAGTPKRLAQVIALSQSVTKSATRRLQKPFAYVSSRYGTGVAELRLRIIDTAHGRTPAAPEPKAARADAREGSRGGREKAEYSTWEGGGTLGGRGGGRGSQGGRGEGRGGRGARGARGRGGGRGR